MELRKAEQLATSLMTKHGLSSWGFKFDNAKRRFGVCRHSQRIIGLSKSLTMLNDEERVKNTILHEIAHAIVGGGHGHDNVWKRKAKEIGCDGERCFSSREVEMPSSKYIGECNNCGFEHKKHRLTNKQHSCGVCSRTFNPNNLIQFRLNPNWK